MTEGRARWHVVPLDSKAHDRSAFSCGAPELDRYIREQASQDVRRDLARVFVALEGEGLAVAGFYSLSAASFRKEDLSPDQAKRLPHYPIPAVLLGRLAVDERHRGRRLGAFLLMDALDRVLRASTTLAVHAIVVDARDETAAAFYRKYGFVPFPATDRRLFLPMGTVRQLISSA